MPGSRRLAAQTPNIEAERRRDAVARWRRAIADRLCVQQAARAVGVPVSTLYRWEEQPQPGSRKPLRARKPNRPRGLAIAVEKVRLDNPMWGKRAIGAHLRTAGWTVSDSMAGRILCDLIARGRVMPVRDFMRKCPSRPRANKRPRAIRKPAGIVFEKPGDVVQIDTMTITKPLASPVKHFDAYDPFAKWTVAEPPNRATAKVAASFLDKVLAEMPCGVRAIQIDDGSEFMAEFEAACALKQISLYVLPPRSPKLNGAVERCNQTWRYE